MSTFLPFVQEFPIEDPKQLERQLVSTHVDISNAVNSRIVSSFTTSVIIPNGEKWLLNYTKSKEGYRTVLEFNDSSLTIPHKITRINFVTRLYGCFFNGTTYYSLPYVSSAAVSDQISISVNSTNLVITKGATAPAIQAGLCVIEYL